MEGFSIGGVSNRMKGLISMDHHQPFSAMRGKPRKLQTLDRRDLRGLKLAPPVTGGTGGTGGTLGGALRMG